MRDRLKISAFVSLFALVSNLCHFILLPIFNDQTELIELTKEDSDNGEEISASSSFHYKSKRSLSDNEYAIVYQEVSGLYCSDYFQKLENSPENC